MLCADAQAVVSKPARSLGSRSLSAVFWGAGGAVLRLVLQVGTQIALARMLGPAQYGIFAIGATVISFSGFFSDMGLAYGLIQKASVDDRDIRFVFTWQIVLGTVVSALVYLASGAIAGFFGDARAAPVIQVLSILCLLNALAAPSLNLLKRQLDFKTIQLVQLASYVAGYLLVGIPLAIYGAQVWALVAAWLVQAVLSGLLLYRATRHALKPLLWYDEARRQSGYGGTVLITNIVNWAIGNIDRVIVARAFGTREIGLYATAYNLFYNPTATLLGVVQPVFFSASSRIADEGQRILGAYRTLVAALALVVLPVFAAVAAVPETFIFTLYGDKWADAAALCRPLALVMPMFLLFGLTTPLLWTSGRAAKEFQLQAPIALLWAVACAWAASWSVVHVAWMVLALYSVRCAVVVGVAIRALGLTLTAFWRSARGGVFVSALMAACLAAADAALHALPAWQRLALEVMLGAAIWLALLRWVPCLIAPELASLFERILSQLPRPFARLLGFLARRETRP